MTRTLPFLLVLAAACSFQAQAQEPEPAPPPPSAPAAAPGDSPAAERLSRIQGTVILSRRNPVVGATVVLVRTDAADGPQRVWVTSTDDRGEFRMEAVPEGTYRLEARRSDLQTLVRDGVALRPPFRAVIELTMQPAAGGVAAAGPAAPGKENAATSPLTVQGRTVDREGNPVAEARLRWVDAAGERDPQSLSSGVDGAFTVQGLVPGTWRIEVLGVGFLPVRVDLPIAADTGLTAVLVRQSASHEPLPLDLMPPEEPIPPPAGAGGG